MPVGRPRTPTPQVNIDNFKTNERCGASGPVNAKVMVVGMAPAKEELREKIPLVGPSGRVFNNALRAIGVDRASVRVTNLLHFAAPFEHSIKNVPSSLLAPELERLKAEITETRPNVIVTLGEDALWFLTGKSGIMKWRGSILPGTFVPGTKIVAAHHPAFIIRGMWKWNAVFTHIDLVRARDESKMVDIKYPTRHSITGPSFNVAIDYLRSLENAKTVAFDIETKWWSRSRMGEIACVAFAARPDEAICIPFIRSNNSHYWTESEEASIWRAIAKLLQNKKVKKVAQNASFEWLYFWKHGVYPWPLSVDTMTLHHCLYPDWGTAEDYTRKKKFDEPGHGLAFICSQYTRSPFYKDDGKFWSPELGEHQFWNYNAMDAMVTFEVAEKMMCEARDEKLSAFYHEQYIRPFYSAVRAEWFGTPIDDELRSVVATQYEERATQLQSEINKAVGYVVNVNSPVQMQQLLYRVRGYQVKNKLQTGKPTADKDTLRYFAYTKQDPLLLKILELRKIRDVISDFIKQPLDENGNIHTHYRIGGTDGLRWSAGKSILGNGINFQNIPRDGIARKLFIAR